MDIIETTGENVSPDIRAAFKDRKVDPSGTIMDAHRQWATRSPDEAVWSVDEALKRTKEIFQKSRQKDVAWETLSVKAHGERLALEGKGGKPAFFTNWAMTQAAGIVGAPASYLAKLPAKLAAECLTYGINEGIDRKSDANLLVSFRDGDDFDLRSLVSSKYERVWDHQLTMRVASLCERGTWGPAQAFRTATAERAAHAWGEAKPLPLGWIGDRSSFILLVDYEGAVTTKTGQKLARFVMLQNSEVGKCALKITIGLLDMVCANMIMWNCTEVKEARLSHTKNIQQKWVQLMAPMHRRLSAGDTETIVDKIAAVQKKILGEDKEKVVARVVLSTKLPKTVVENAFVRAENTPRYGDPHSAWGMVQGLTEESQHATTFADERAEIDKAAAKLFAGF